MLQVVMPSRRSWDPQLSALIAKTTGVARVISHRLETSGMAKELMRKLPSR